MQNNDTTRKLEEGKQASSEPISSNMMGIGSPSRRDVADILRRAGAPTLGLQESFAQQPSSDLLMHLGQQQASLAGSLSGGGVGQLGAPPLYLPNQAGIGSNLLGNNYSTLGQFQLDSLSGSNLGFQQPTNNLDALLSQQVALDNVMRQQLLMDRLRSSQQAQFGASTLTNEAEILALLGEQQSLQQRHGLNLASLVAAQQQQQQLGPLSAQGAPVLSMYDHMNPVVRLPTVSLDPSFSPVTFPEKLFKLLLEAKKNGEDHIVSFTPNGTAFVIHDEEAFLKTIVPRYFKQTNIASFRRQLYLYGFAKCSEGRFRGFAHVNFHRDRPDLLRMIRREKKDRK